MLRRVAGVAGGGQESPRLLDKVRRARLDRFKDPVMFNLFYLCLLFAQIKLPCLYFAQDSRKVLNFDVKIWELSYIPCRKILLISSDDSV